MKLTDFMTAVVTDLAVATNRDGDPLFKDVGTHGKVFGADELRQLSLDAPACRVALVGSRGGITITSRSTAPRPVMGRSDIGLYRGPLQMIAFLVHQDGYIANKHLEARDRVIELADEFMYYMEHRVWGLMSDEAGPALVTGFDVFYSAEIDEQGAAIAAVSWEQEVFFGRDLHREDEALLTGDKFGLYPSGQSFWPEGEWVDKGVLSEGTGPLVKGRVTTQHTDEEQPDNEEHTEIDVEK